MVEQLLRPSRLGNLNRVRVHAEDTKETDKIRLDLAKARQEAQFLLGIVQRSDMGSLLVNLGHDRLQIHARIFASPHMPNARSP